MTKPLNECWRDKDAETYVVRAHHEWAFITINEAFGLISVVSSFGNFANIWGHHGCESLKAFLQKVDYAYFFNKVDQPNKGMRWSLEASARATREKIRERRRKDLITKELARDAFNALDRIIDEIDGWQNAEEIYCYLLYESASLSEALHNDFEGISARSRDPQCAGFWEKLWPVFLEQVKPQAKEVA